MLENEIAKVVQTAIEAVIGPLVTRLEALEALAAKRHQSDRQLLPEKDAAEVLGLARDTLKKKRCKGQVKAHTPPGARVPLYSWADIQRIMNQLAEKN